LAGPALLIAAVYPFLAPRLEDTGKTAAGGAAFVLVLFGTWAVGAIGLPLLGASLGAGRWVGRDLGRRLANHCIGGALAGGILAGLLVAVAPALRSGWGGTLVRLAIAEAGLVVGVLLCFRGTVEERPAG
jgi:hypothetical protein